VLVVTFGLFARGLLGGGDAKLAAATALWLGFEHLPAYLLLAALLGGALTLAILQFRWLPLPMLVRRQSWAERLHRRNGGIPYGAALGGAALLVYPHTTLMMALGS
jgi:prepilin peptidase CpaA